MTEKPLRSVPGVPAVVALLLLALGAIALFVTSLETDTRDARPAGLALAVLLSVAAVVLARGLVILPPNQAKAALFLGRYIGTLREAGFFWINPFTIRRTISLRIRNFDSDVLKVNDALGNPVEIAAVVAWQIQDTAQALFEVDDFEEFVRIQAETAVRHVASEYPYDDFDEGQASLRANADEVIATLQQELQQRLQVAGVAVLDTRLRRLAYAPEIAGEMLRRQQATAVVAARRRIVEGAVGMVEMALDSLSERSIVQLDEERKAAMVSNLLVVLVSDRGAQPVVNSGSLYT